MSTNVNGDQYFLLKFEDRWVYDGSKLVEIFMINLRKKLIQMLILLSESDVELGIWYG